MTDGAKDVPVKTSVSDTGQIDIPVLVTLQKTTVKDIPIKVTLQGDSVKDVLTKASLETYRVDYGMYGESIYETIPRQSIFYAQGGTPDKTIAVTDPYWFLKSGDTESGTEGFMELGIGQNTSFDESDANLTAFLRVTADGGAQVKVKPGVIFMPLASAPATIDGMLYYDSTIDKLKYYGNSQWNTLDTGAGAPDPHGSGSHTGQIFPGADQDLGAFYMDIGEISTPANPGANVRRLFVDDGTNQVSVRTTGGATVSLEGAGGGPGTGTQWSLPVWATTTTLGDSPIEQNSSGTEIYMTTDVFIGADATSPAFKNNADALEIYSGSTPTLALTLEADQDAVFAGDVYLGTNELIFTTAVIHPSGTDIHLHPGSGNADGALHIHPLGTNTASLLELRSLVGANYGAVNLKIDGTTASIDSLLGGSGTAPTTFNITDSDWASINIGDSSATVTLGDLNITTVPAGVSDYDAFLVLDTAEVKFRTGAEVLSDIGAAATGEAHVLATTGPHTSTLPLADLAVGTQGGIIRRGAADWEEYALGTETYVLKAGATDVSWDTVDWSELTGTQPSPISHDIVDHDTTATGAELTELTDSSETTLHSHAAGGGPGSGTQWTIPVWDTTTTLGDSMLSQDSGGTILTFASDLILGDVASVANYDQILFNDGAKSQWLHHDITGTLQITSNAYYDSGGWHGASSYSSLQLYFDTNNDKMALMFSDTGTTTPSFAEVFTVSGAGAITSQSIIAATSDLDKFLVSDSGQIKFRTGAEAYSDMDGYVTADFTTDFAAEDFNNLATTAHVLASADHTVSGLTTGDILSADSVSTYSWKTNPAAMVPLALTDLASYTQGSIIIGGGADWEALVAGTEDYVLKMGVSEPAWGQVDYSELSGSQPAPISHDFDVHSGDVDLTDLEAGTQGSIIRRGAADWEELGLGTTNYALVSGATDVVWAQYDYTWLANIPSSFTPAAHVLATTGPHSSALPLTDIASYTQGSIIIGGGADWEALGAGTETYVLKMGANEPAWGQVDYSELTGSQPAPISHDFDVHSGDVDLADIASYVQGSIIRGGGSDWEAYALGTETYVLKAGATDVAWGQVDYSELTGTQPAPVAHVLATTGPHTGTLPLTDLAAGTQGGIIRRGASDWEEYALGTETYVLKAGATDAVWGTVDWSELTGTQPAPVSHDFDVHSGDVDIGDLSDYTAGRILYGGASDWVTLTGGTEDYVLKMGATYPAWGQVDYSELSGSQPAPVAHNLIDTTGHPVSGLTGGHFLKALTTTTYGFAAHGLTASDVGAAPAFTETQYQIAMFDTTTTIGNSVIKQDSGGTIVTIDSTTDKMELTVSSSDDYAEINIFSTATVANHPMLMIGKSAVEDHAYLMVVRNTSSSVFDSLLIETDTTGSGTDGRIEFKPAGTLALTLNVDGSATIGTISAEGTDVDTFLVSNAGLVKSRTGAQAYSDMDGYVTADFATDFAAESLANLGTRTHVSLSDAPTDAHHDEAHVLAVTGPHTGTLPLADLAAGTQGSVIRRGAADWEEYALGTETYVLKAGATDVAWGQVDYSELGGSQPAPISHDFDVHSGDVDLVDIASYVQGSIIIGGSTDWEALIAGTETYVLKMGASEPSWSTVDWSELSGSQPAPIAHGQSAHTGDVIPDANQAFAGTLSMTPTDTTGNLMSITSTASLSGPLYAISVDLTGITLNNQPVGGLIVQMPATYGGSGVEYAAGFAGDSRTVLIATDTYALDVTGEVLLNTINAEGSDVDKFLVDSSGVIKFRTGAEVLSDIGAASVPLALTDLASYTQGSIIIGGGADWEALVAGTEDYVLKMGAAEPTWGQVDWSDLAGSQPAPIAHVLDSASHTISGKTGGHFLKADTSTTYSFQAHGLTYSDVGAVDSAGAVSAVVAENPLTLTYDLTVSGGDINAPSGLNINAASSINMRATGDTSDYWYFSTAGDVAKIIPIDNNVHDIGTSGLRARMVYTYQLSDGTNEPTIAEIAGKAGLGDSYASEMFFAVYNASLSGTGYVLHDTNGWYMSVASANHFTARYSIPIKSLGGDGSTRTVIKQITAYVYTSVNAGRCHLYLYKADVSGAFVLVGTNNPAMGGTGWRTMLYNCPDTTFLASDMLYIKIITGSTSTSAVRAHNGIKIEFTNIV